jgi:triosephosphate isomerase (TIM)
MPADKTVSSGRKPLMSGNWKMHLNHFEALQTVQKLHYKLTRADYDAVDVSVHPPFTDLRTVQTAIESDHMSLILGAQHCHWEEKGAFTGEVAAPMLAKLQVRYVIVGHSERRQLFGQTDEQVNATVRAVVAQGMTPIMCVGETLEERESGATEARVRAQLRAGLARVDRVVVAGMVVAYEPIWAIGTGRTATPADAQAVCGALRAEVASIAGPDAAASVRIQYGGSVKAANIAELMAEPDIDGALVGGASLDPDEFAGIAQYRSRTS